MNDRILLRGREADYGGEQNLAYSPRVASEEMDKRALREQMRRLRKDVSFEARIAYSRAMSEALLADDSPLSEALACRGPIAVYFAVRDEIDLAAFIEAVLSRGCRLAAPRWTGEAYELTVFSTLSDLVEGPMHVLEPKDGTVVASSDVRGWLIPELALTSGGWRLGYGGGWYDRLLSSASETSVKIGVAYPFQVVEALPSEAHDIRLTCVQTIPGVVG